MLGGGNSKQLKELPPGCRLGDNANAFVGGFRLWARADTAPRAVAQPRGPPPRDEALALAATSKDARA